MKILNFSFLSLFIGILCFSFVACSDDNDPKVNND